MFIATGNCVLLTKILNASSRNSLSAILYRRLDYSLEEAVGRKAETEVGVNSCLVTLIDAFTIDVYGILIRCK